MIHLISEEILSPPTNVQEASNSNLGDSETVYSDDLYHEGCVEINTEQEAYGISQDLDPNDPYGMMPGLSRGRCRYCRRHTQCTRGWYILPWSRSRNRGPVNTVDPKKHKRTALLRVSKTVYHEANAILCANTVFSFKLAHTLTIFPRHLTPLQRPAVRVLHLDIYLDAEHDTWSWKSDDLRDTIAALPGLRDLHLNIKQRCQGDFGAFLQTLQEGSLPLWSSDLSHFSRSSLRNVTVIIEDIDPSSLHDWNMSDKLLELRLRLDYMEREGHWTMAERVEYARVLREKLLAISTGDSKCTCE